MSKVSEVLSCWFPINWQNLYNLIKKGISGVAVNKFLNFHQNEEFFKVLRKFFPFLAQSLSNGVKIPFNPHLWMSYHSDRDICRESQIIIPKSAAFFPILWPLITFKCHRLQFSQFCFHQVHYRPFLKLLPKNSLLLKWGMRFFLQKRTYFA
jgi:hypothetical protein